jgi:hypothetical protein
MHFCSYAHVLHGAFSAFDDQDAGQAISFASDSMVETSIVAERVEPDARLHALPRHFGVRLMLAVEREVFRTLKELAAEYRGGDWHFYDLSNGGFYMAPDLGALEIRVPGNHFRDVLSADAAGIVACLLSYSHLSSACRSELLAEHYHRLQAFARTHQESAQILSAID